MRLITAIKNSFLRTNITFFESQEFAYLQATLSALPKKLKTAIDVGAHTGTITTQLIKMGFMVYAIEPEPHLAAILRNTFRQELLKKKVVILEVAASDIDGNANLWIGEADTLSSLEMNWTTVAFPEYFEQKKSIQVKTECLSSIFQEHSIDRIGFLKIDTEGHDLRVLRGTFGGATSPVPLIVMFEANKRFPNAALKCLELLRENDYHTYDIFIKEGEHLLSVTRFDGRELPGAWYEYTKEYFYANIIAYHPKLVSYTKLPQLQNAHKITKSNL